MKLRKKNKKTTAPFRRLFLKKINISNFKSFKNNNQIELAPMVNLIFGQNSAGKSSIFQALRLFRQSYSPGSNLALFNYEAPPELRGKGGLDIDIEYKGIVNEGDIKKKIELGVNIGQFMQSNESITNSSQINYKFKYVPKFYKGKNLIKNKTIPSNINFSTGEDFISIDFTNHVFFKDNDPKFSSLRPKEYTFRLQQRNSALNKEIGANPYGSIYDPFFFETKINKNETKLNSINKIYDIFSSIKKEKIIEVLSLIEKSISKKDDKKNNKWSNEERFFERRSNTRNIRKKINQELFDKKLSPESRVDWFLKNPDFVEIFKDSYYKGFKNEKFKSSKWNNRLNLFLKLIKKVNLNKETFYNYFFNDILGQSENIIFFKGEFIEDPRKNKNNTYISPLFRESEDPDIYLINVFSWLFFVRNDFGYLENFISIYSIYDRSNTRFGGKDAMYEIQASMNKMIIVPGLRSMPKRYFVKGMQTNYVGAQAENLAELLANPKIRTEANYWLNKLEIPYDVNIQSSGNYYEIVFKPKKSNINVAQTHIGLGYPLILPLIVQSLISRNKIIVVEEPEVHLHPKIEADLAELIVFSSLNYHNQFLIETHSEEFLLRVLKNIRENKIKPQDISINYITNNRKEKKHKGSIINKIIVNSYGQYQTPWKDDLFAERRIEFK